MYPDDHAHKLLDIAAEQQPIAVHVFSNGGAFLWARALAIAAKRGSKELTRVRGQIIDSAPGSFTDLKGGYHFLTEMVGTPLTLLVAPFLTLAGIVWYTTTLQWIPRWSTELAWKRDWVNNSRIAGIHQTLLLFSEDDLLISAQSVRNFSNVLATTATANHKSSVKQKIWSKSKHVQHYRYHPRQYQEAVIDFMQEL